MVVMAERRRLGRADSMGRLRISPSFDSNGRDAGAWRGWQHGKTMDKPMA